jgi:hypothetical protein
VEFVCFGFVFLGVAALVLAVHHHEQVTRSRRLFAFQRALEGGRGRTELGLFDSLQAAWVRGDLDGRPVSLTFERRGSGKHAYDAMIYGVEVDNPAAEFQLAKAGVLDRLGQWIGLTRPTDLHPEVDDDLILRKGSTSAVKGLLQQGAVARAIRRLTEYPLGFAEVRLADGALRVERPVNSAHLDLPALRGVFDALLAVARQCERRRVTVKIKGLSVKARFAWTDGGQAARCPYCRDELRVDDGSDDLGACDRCGTLHHRACLDEAGGCTIFGCGARRASERLRPPVRE